jgi:hypothetical protein
LLPPDRSHDADSSTNEDSSSFVDLGQEDSRQPSPFLDLSSPDHKSRQDGDEHEASFLAWDTQERPSEEGHDHAMPSDLRSDHTRSKSHQHQPLLNGDKRTSYDSPVRLASSP